MLELLSQSGIQLPDSWSPPNGVSTAVGVFAGYVLLDAWIGNTDRHHENWGLILRPRTDPGQPWSLHLAPTFDHASSLGRNEADEQRLARLHTTDPGFSVAAYAQRCRSALYGTEEDAKPLSTRHAFVAAAGHCPTEARVWLEHLERIPSSSVEDVFRRMPPARISSPAVSFALALLAENRARLLDLKGTLP